MHDDLRSVYATVRGWCARQSKGMKVANFVLDALRFGPNTYTYSLYVFVRMLKNGMIKRQLSWAWVPSRFAHVKDKRMGALNYTSASPCVVRVVPVGEELSDSSARRHNTDATEPRATKPIKKLLMKLSRPPIPTITSKTVVAVSSSRMTISLKRM